MQAIAIKGELDRALAKRRLTKAVTDVDAAVKTTVENMLAAAQRATLRGRFRWRSLIDRWRGTSVECANCNLHAAKIALVDVLDEREVNARIPGGGGPCRYLPQSHRRAPREHRQTPRRSRLVRGGKRAGLKRALEIGYDASDQLHVRLRGFRNILIMVGITILLFMVAMVMVVSMSLNRSRFALARA
jgi:hypothetical protein